VLVPLLATLAVLSQAPAPPPASPAPAPLTVHVPALEAAGVPAHVVDFCQEHLYAELQRQGFAVQRADAGAEAGRAQAVVTGELVLFPSGFRVTTRARSSDGGTVLAEHVAEAVPEQRLLDAITEAVSALAPQVRAQLSPAQPLVAHAPTASAERPLRRWAWAPAAGGVVFLGAGTVFLLQARAREQELEAAPSGQEPLDGEAVASEGRRAQTLSRVSFALGGAGLLAGAALYFLPVEQLWGGGGTQSVRLHAGPGGVAVSGVLP
jgi:hypothetical protein